MPILFSAVARGSLVLAQCAGCTGNFIEITKQVLSQILPEYNKLTYFSNNYLFHYIAENELVYFCITDNNFSRQTTFLFLNEIKKRFLATFQDMPSEALPYAAMNHRGDGDFARIIESEMMRFNNSNTSLPLVEADAELDELENIMIMELRGLSLDLGTSTSLTRSAVYVRRKHWWNIIKM